MSIARRCPKYSPGHRPASATFATKGVAKATPVGGALCGFQGAKLEKEL